MLRSLVLTLIAATICLGSDTPNDSRLTSPLIRAGVRLDDEPGLIRVLQSASEDPRLATCAAYALGKLSSSANAISELNLVAAVSKDEILANYAIRSLIRMGDKKWIGPGVARLPNTHDPVQQIGLAAALAEVGHYEGWNVLERSITEGDEGVQEVALHYIGAFRGMKDASDRPIDLAAKLETLRQLASEPRRGAISQKIRQLAAEREKQVR